VNHLFLFRAVRLPFFCFSSQFYLPSPSSSHAAATRSFKICDRQCFCSDGKYRRSPQWPTCGLPVAPPKRTIDASVDVKSGASFNQPSLNKWSKSVAAFFRASAVTQRPQDLSAGRIGNLPEHGVALLAPYCNHSATKMVTDRLPIIKPEGTAIRTMPEQRGHLLLNIS
jgi:hypothetical protein